MLIIIWNHWNQKMHCYQNFLLYHVKYKCNKFLAKNIARRETTTLWDWHNKYFTRRPRDNHTYNFWAIGKLVMVFLQLYSYLSGNSLGWFCLFINSTWAFQSFHFRNFTGILQPNDGPFSTGRKCLKGGKVMYWNIAFVEDRWTWNLDSEFLDILINFKPF